jgi:1-acyl-sn-glycerol-3-phosphate acyltransferase
MNAFLKILSGVALGLFLLALFLFLMRWLVQPLLRLVLWPRYRLILVGREHIPPGGPVLIVANHVSWLDGIILAATVPRHGQALVNASYIDWPLVRHWARWIGLIAVPISGPKAQRALLETCRKILDDGFALGIFPEAQISRNGFTGPFHRGLEVILAGRDLVAVVPAYLENVWGSFFSFSGGHFFRKRPRGWRRTVIIAFGPSLDRPITAFAARQAVLEAGVSARERLGLGPWVPETVDPALPHLEHPELGPLTASTADFDDGVVRQTGHRAGTLGQPLPGVAFRALDEAGQALGPDHAGRLVARVAGRVGWSDTGFFGSMDRDGFLRVTHE